MLVSALTDALGESKVSALDLAGNTTEFNQIVKANIQSKFKEIGLMLTNLFIENMSVPQEVEKAIDERSKLGILGDKTDVMMKIAAAEAMKDAAKNEGMGGTFMGAGVGIGAGAGMGAVFADAFRSAANTSTDQKPQNQTSSKVCTNCGASLSAKAKFCAECGTKVETKRFCTNCGAELSGNAKFCAECGAKQ
jgi:membrane protease subunit (stomatin/prohibitin family)